MLRRLILSFSLIFLFALGQQGAVLHEISHYAEVNPSSQQQDKAPHSSVCDKCLSYGELASALSVHYFAPPILAAGYELTAFSSSSHPSNTLLSYLARGPPLAS